MKPLALMKKIVLLALAIAGCFLIASTIPRRQTTPETPVFVVQTVAGKTVELTNVKYDPLYESSDYTSKVWLDTDIGYFDMSKDLQDVRLIEVLSDDGTQLKVTFQDGEVLEGKRKYREERSDKTRNPLDSLHGVSGRVNVVLPLSEIVLIVRKEQGNG